MEMKDGEGDDFTWQDWKVRYFLALRIRVFFEILILFETKHLIFPYKVNPGSIVSPRFTRSAKS